MDYFIDKYEQLEQTNRLLENIEAKLNAMNIPQMEGNQAQYQSNQQQQRSQQHPLIDNYLLSTNGGGSSGQESKNDYNKQQDYPKIQLSTQVLQDDLLISGYEQFKSGSNQFNSGVNSISFAQTNKQQGNDNGTQKQWTVTDGANNSKIIVNAYQSTEKINNLLLGETESQVIDSDPKRENLQFNQKSSRSSDQNNQNSNTSRSNRSKSWNKSLKSQTSEDLKYQNKDNVNKSNVSKVSNKSSNSSSSSSNKVLKNKAKKMYIGSGQKEQLIKIEENNIDEDELEEDHSNSSPFVNENKDQHNGTQHYSPISLDYTKSLNNTQNNNQNTLHSLNRGDNNILKNNSQLEDELNTLRNRLYLINHSYSKLAQQQSLSDLEVQNSQRKIYSLAQQMKDIAESLQNMDQLQFTQKTQMLNNGYRFNNELSDSKQFSSGKKVNKLSADKYEDIIIDDKVFLLEKENRRLKKENQMLKDEIEDYKEKMNRLFHDHQSTRLSLEKHLELKFETQMLNMKEAQKIILNEKDSKISILQKQLEEIKTDRETMKKELFSFRQSFISQRMNTSAQNNQQQTSFENKSFEQPYLASYYPKNSLQDNKDKINQSLIENSILSQNYGASNSYLDQKRLQTTNNHNKSSDHQKILDRKISTEPTVHKSSINDYVRTDIDSNLLKNNKTHGDLHQKKSRQNSEYIKTERGNSKEKHLNTSKPPKLKKVGQQDNKKSRSKSPINYSEQIQHLIRQSENLNKLKSQLRTDTSLSNSRKETHPSLMTTTTQNQKQKQKKQSPKRSKSSIGQRTSIKM